MSGRAAFGLTVGAFGWSLVLIVGAFTYPVYAGSTSTSAGASVETTATLVEVNGTGILWLMALPAIGSLVAWVGLHRRCSRGSLGGLRLAGGVTCALLVLSLLGAMTVGVFMAPVALALSAACGLTPEPAR